VALIRDPEEPGLCFVHRNPLPCERCIAAGLSGAWVPSYRTTTSVREHQVSETYSRFDTFSPVLPEPAWRPADGVKR
jgi:hypothetical protein